MTSRAVFLDRDNTVIADPGYLADPAGVQLLPGVAGALQSLSEAGFKLVLVTNQSGIARGKLTVETLEGIHDELQRQLAERGAKLDAIYTCPYHPDGTIAEYASESDERKPAPGMLLRAAREMNIDLRASWMVGDRSRDIVAGRDAGCRTIRVLTGSDEGEEQPVDADYTSANLVEASRVILSGGTQGGRLSTPAPRRAAEPAPLQPQVEQVCEVAEADEPAEASEPVDARVPAMTNNEILAELLRLTRQKVRLQRETEFSVNRLIAGICQGVAVLALALGLLRFLPVSGSVAASDSYWIALGWFTAATVLQLMALTFFTMAHRD